MMNVTNYVPLSGMEYQQGDGDMNVAGGPPVQDARHRHPDRGGPNEQHAPLEKEDGMMMALLTMMMMMITSILGKEASDETGDKQDRPADQYGDQTPNKTVGDASQAQSGGPLMQMLSAMMEMLKELFGGDDKGAADGTKIGDTNAAANGLTEAANAAQNANGGEGITKGGGIADMLRELAELVKTDSKGAADGEEGGPLAKLVDLLKEMVSNIFGGGDEDKSNGTGKKVDASKDDPATDGQFNRSEAEAGLVGKALMLVIGLLDKILGGSSNGAGSESDEPKKENLHRTAA